jgi:hypothetical protein
VLWASAIVRCLAPAAAVRCSTSRHGGGVRLAARSRKRFGAVNRRPAVILVGNWGRAPAGLSVPRDRATFTAEQWAVHHQAAQMFEHLATIDPEHVRLLDRREHDTKTLVATIGEWIITAPPPPPPFRPAHSGRPQRTRKTRRSRPWLF